MLGYFIKDSWRFILERIALIIREFKKLHTYFIQYRNYSKELTKLLFRIVLLHRFCFVSLSKKLPLSQGNSQESMWNNIFSSLFRSEVLRQRSQFVSLDRESFSRLLVWLSRYNKYSDPDTWSDIKLVRGFYDRRNFRSFFHISSKISSYMRKYTVCRTVE